MQEFYPSGLERDLGMKLLDDLQTAIARNLQVMRYAEISGERAQSMLLSVLCGLVARISDAMGDESYGRDYLDAAIEDWLRNKPKMRGGGAGAAKGCLQRPPLAV
jgi:hypothetical protein